MKYCPTCDTRYDEEELLFCMKDGTPLAEISEPSFTRLPSESDDDAGEVTVIRKDRKPAPVPPASAARDRIVVPTSGIEQPPPVERRTIPPRPRVIPEALSQRQQPSTGKVIVLTVLGTLAALAIGGIFFWFLQRSQPSENITINTNFNNSLENMNANSNMNMNAFDSFNTNLNTDLNANAFPTLNTNIANIRTPSPTPSPTPKPSPAATATPEEPDETPTPQPATPRPTPQPTRSIPPPATPTPIVVGTPGNR